MVQKSGIQRSHYDIIVDLLDQIVSEDPDFEEQSEADFIGDIAEKSGFSFTSSEALRVRVIFKKYVRNK